MGCNCKSIRIKSYLVSWNLIISSSPEETISKLELQLERKDKEYLKEMLIKGASR